MGGQPNVTPAMKPHVAVCPSAGMGHLAPFLTLASTLSSFPYNCTVTVVVVVPFITAAESDEISSFFSSHHHITRLDFHVDLVSPTATADPFCLRYGSISRSAHHLARRLSTLTPPISAAFSDILLTKGFNSTINNNYTVVTTSARFFSLMAYLTHLVEPPPPGLPVDIPGLGRYPSDNIPPPFFHPNHIFTSLIASNHEYLHLSKGILVNSFDSFEPETLTAIKSGRALSGLLPPLFPVGPLCKQHEEEEEDDDALMSWLDDQPENSVIYVSFGNRPAMSRDQIRELGIGLDRSGYPFIWVVKTSMVDKDEKGLGDILGQELEEKLCKKGKVVVKWVNQVKILKHKAVEGFMSHCGWNSVKEAARYGVPVMAWPQHGDQRENAGVVEKVGLGVWDRGWGKVVMAAEIVDKLVVVMEDGELRKSATWIGGEAKKACDHGGTSMLALMSIVHELKA